MGALRSAASVDFDSLTVTAGIELRAWLRASTPMRGPFAGVHASVGHTRLYDNAAGYIGASTSLNQWLGFGWRFVVRDRFAIAPALGLVMHEDFSASGRLATGPRITAAIGLELGWVIRSAHPESRT